MSKTILTAPSGSKHILLGNEAIVRGALEAGVNVVTCYPGTPSSEVPDTFRRLGGKGADGKQIYRLEYSVNEKVALEVAAGAALAGAMALTTMKHVGVNVAADPLLTMTYTGLPGGLVLLSADDPGCHSSQNEQDNRYYARMASMPCFEPATAQEAKDMTVAALKLARETQQPVLLRTTTRVSHMRGSVKFGPLPEERPLVPFERNPGRYVPVPAVARKRHLVLAEAMAKLKSTASDSPFNKFRGEGRLGIIASGISRAYLSDAIHAGGLEGRFALLELGMTWPLSVDLLGTFMSGCEKILVLEEGEPLLERDVRVMAQKLGFTLPIFGKNEYLTIFGEYSTPLVERALSDFVGGRYNPAPIIPATEGLPVRPPNLCPGCSHRAVYYAVRKVFGNDAFYSSDIGCYTLGLLPPLSTADFLFCMGSSVSAGSGFAAASGKQVVAFIGDSTFFHSGITGLVNAVFNRHNIILFILDNGATAMTGHQPNPGVDQEQLGEAALHVDIEGLVRACGVSEVARIKPFNIKKSMQVMEDMKGKSGVRVIIAQEYCVLYARRVLKKSRARVSRVAEQGSETAACLTQLACPAFRQDEDGFISVDKNLCGGCMVCLQIAPGCFAGDSYEK